MPKIAYSVRGPGPGWLRYASDTEKIGKVIRVANITIE